MKNMAKNAIVLVMIIAIVIGGQLISHCYNVDLRIDEASHYVSGLMIHDYLLSDLTTSPMDFLKSFHSHYPLVGIGHWGPLYYCIEAIWMIFFSTNFVSILALSATITIVTAFGVYVFGNRMSGWFAGASAAIAFTLSPIVQMGTSELMLDIPVALLCLAAMSAYAQFMKTGAILPSVAFAIAASAALLIKGNAGCLALMPPLAILFARRFDLLHRLSFWLPLPIVGILVGPWYAFSYELVAVGFRYEWSWDYVADATVTNADILVGSVGPLILIAAFAGFVASIKRAWTHGGANGQSAACALFVSVWIFQSVIPAALQARYLVPLLPPLLILAAEGIRLIAIQLRSVFRGPTRTAEATLSLLLVVSIIPGTMKVQAKPELGFVATAPQVWRALPTHNRAVLIATDGEGEAAAIAALAMNDPQRPSLFAIRGSRLLGDGGYNNQDYVPRFKTAQEAMATIDDYNIPLMIYRQTAVNTSWLHLEQLAELQKSEPLRWREIYQNTNVYPEITLLRINGNELEISDPNRLLSLSAPRALRDQK